MCTLWPLHSKWLSRVTSLHQILHEAWKFLHRNYSDNSEGCSYGQLHHTTHLLVYHILWIVFLWNIKSPRWLSLFTAQIEALRLLAFPQTKITFEWEEISDSRWDLGKYDRAADGDWENCVRSQSASFEGDRGIIVLCTMFLVSSSIFVSVFHMTWLDTFWTDLVWNEILCKDILLS